MTITGYIIYLLSHILLTCTLRHSVVGLGLVVAMETQLKGVSNDLGSYIFKSPMLESVINVEGMIVRVKNVSAPVILDVNEQDDCTLVS